MLKRTKQSKRERTVSRPTNSVVSVATLDESIIVPPTKAQISLLMAQLGRKGGKKGGKRRLETMTSEERVEVAKKAARARWKHS